MPPPARLRAAVPAAALFAANTGVGKTVAAAALCRAAAAALARPGPARPAAPQPVLYLKPVQTGFPADSDARHVATFCPGVRSSVLFTFTEPASPHLTALQENRVTDDSVLRDRIAHALDAFAAQLPPAALGMAFVETAGGVLSPTMSGSLQADAYRPFRLPAVLVGDSNLGGISTTLSSYEALRIRGFDVPCVVLFDNPKYQNHDVIERCVDKDTRVFTIPAPPPPPPAAQTASSPTPSPDDLANMSAYYAAADPHAARVVHHLLRTHAARLERLNHLATAADTRLWWPFTQHAATKAPTVIDSAHGDDFVVFDASRQSTRALFDACASWWTQAVGHGNPRLARAAARAAGRYGHVIFPEAVHEPAMRLAERLVASPGRGWASRVFYSDDGSTATEVALKMAFKRVVVSQGLVKPRLDVIGIEGAYHGDTIGAMSASNPNVYNDKVDWYTGRGVWLAPPTLVFKDGAYRVRIPDAVLCDADPANAAAVAATTFASRDAVFDKSRDNSALAAVYRAHIASVLDAAEREGRVFGALMLEPVLLGAGGMLWVDPLFQRELIRAVRTRKPDAPVPVIYDEVFVGMYRLGFPSAGASLLHETPDIACYAKCLTGIVPLAVTLASEHIFEAFLAPTKVDALLHGHSFTAHPVGCEVALESLDMLEELHNARVHTPGSDAASGSAASAASDNQAGAAQSTAITSVWDSAMLDRIAALPCVQGVVALGTVLAIELAASQQGYASTAAAKIVQSLRAGDGDAVFARPLGNVLYLMATHETPAARIGDVLGRVHSLLCDDADSDRAA